MLENLCDGEALAERRRRRSTAKPRSGPRRGLFAEAQRQIDASITRFRTEGIETGIARGRFRCSTTIYFEAGRRELDRYCPFRRPVEPTSGGHAGADATFATVHGGAGKCCGRRQRHQSHHLWFRQVTKLQRHCPRYGFFAAQLDPRGGSRPGECAICRVRTFATRRQEISCCGGTDRL